MRSKKEVRRLASMAAATASSASFLAPSSRGVTVHDLSFHETVIG
jgi:hypothetical protein